MAVGIAKVKAPAPFARVELPVLKTPGAASIWNSRFPHALKNTIELGIADMKSVVVVLKRFSVVEVKRQLVIDPDGSKVPGWPGVLKSE